MNFIAPTASLSECASLTENEIFEDCETLLRDTFRIGM